MPHVPGNYANDSAKGAPKQPVKLPTPVQIPKSAAQKPAK
jgi:hypothetical protein